MRSNITNINEFIKEAKCYKLNDNDEALNDYTITGNEIFNHINSSALNQSNQIITIDPSELHDTLCLFAAKYDTGLNNNDCQAYIIGLYQTINMYYITPFTGVSLIPGEMIGFMLGPTETINFPIPAMIEIEKPF